MSEVEPSLKERPLLCVEPLPAHLSRVPPSPSIPSFDADKRPCNKHMKKHTRARTHTRSARPKGRHTTVSPAPKKLLSPASSSPSFGSPCLHLAARPFPTIRTFTQTCMHKPVSGEGVCEQQSSNMRASKGVETSMFVPGLIRVQCLPPPTTPLPPPPHPPRSLKLLPALLLLSSVLLSAQTRARCQQ
jgi:hypothetical protein